jgi:hypothetical protein
MPFAVSYDPRAEDGYIHVDFSEAPEADDARDEWFAREERLRRGRRLPGTRTATEVAAAGEIYLELIDVDLDEVDSILDFVDRFGILGTRYADYDLFVELPGFEKAVLPQLKGSWRYEVQPMFAGRFRARWMMESLTEFRFASRCIRDLVTAWQIVQSDSDPAKDVAWAAIPSGYSHIPSPTTIDGRVHVVESRTAVLTFLAHMLQAGLLPFHPRLVRSEDPPSGREYLFEGAPLYSVCCLELFNHIAEHATYRHCANETCGRTFVRQTGRAEAGQHRTSGVKYCSSHCARAQAQRDHRARQRRQAAAE